MLRLSVTATCESAPTMAASRVQHVAFGDIAAVAKDFYQKKNTKTIFVFDLDDTLFSARGDDDVDPGDYAGLDGPGAPTTVWFSDLQDDVPGFFVQDVADFLRELDDSEWTVLTAGSGVQNDMDGNRIALMLGRESWAQQRMAGMRTAYVRTGRKLDEVEKLATAYPKHQIVFFDDRMTAFARAEEMPCNVKMLHVMARDDD